MLMPRHYADADAMPPAMLIREFCLMYCRYEALRASHFRHAVQRAVSAHMR